LSYNRVEFGLEAEQQCDCPDDGIVQAEGGGILAAYSGASVDQTKGSAEYDFGAAANLRLLEIFSLMGGEEGRY
jgi:hypothetical protein